VFGWGNLSYNQKGLFLCVVVFGAGFEVFSCLERLLGLVSLRILALYQNFHHQRTQRLNPILPDFASLHLSTLLVFDFPFSLPCESVTKVE